MFGGMFKKSKPFGARTQSQVRVVRLALFSHFDLLLEDDDGTFVSRPQEDVSASRDLSASKDDLSVKSNTKVKCLLALKLQSHDTTVPHAAIRLLSLFQCFSFGRLGSL